MSSPTFRKLILDDVVSRLSGAFNITSGTTEKIFRSVIRGQLQPQPAMRPCLTVADGGQIRVDDGETDTGWEKELTITVWIHIDENWERVTAQQNWSDRVEKIIASIHKYLPARGMIRMDYVNDQPLDAIFLSGATEAVWEITFRAVYLSD